MPLEEGLGIALSVGRRVCGGAVVILACGLTGSCWRAFDYAKMRVV